MTHHRQPPAFRNQSRPRGLWRRTPPAIFPPVFGLLGLGLAWRRAAEVAGLPAGIAEGLLGAVSLLYLFCLLAYLGKVVQRPGVLVDDLAILPGLAGVTAANLSLMLLAAVLVPYAPSLAQALIVVALPLQLLLGGFLLWQWRRGQGAAQTVTPVWLMVLVGPIIAPLAMIPLGFGASARLIAVAMILPAVVVWGVSLWQIVTRIPPAPLRPLLAIHLAPASLFATVWALLGQPSVAMLFCGFAIALFLALLLALPWLVRAGFSPLWGAFTFPLAAFCAALLVNGWLVAGLLLLAGASAAILPIAVLILRDWARGGLAARTNAAEA